ncbi:hypothetical protein ABTX24_13485 [Nocardioides sp. NPDC127514]|uniref:hypothetical protein n=1 Tax=unclassified Nocardioides TaxID=2615069 RepID=UPI0033233AB1
MSAIKSRVMTWAANLLECLPDVELHGFDIEADYVPALNAKTKKLQMVPAVTLSVRPAGYDAAKVLAESLSLPESDPSVKEDGLGLFAWHTWQGWVPEASTEVAVRVEITTTERLWLAEEVA